MPTLLLTRPVERLEPLKSMLEQRGWTVWHQPMIEIRPPENWHEIDEAVRQMENNAFDWIVFSSRYGVEFFCDRIGTKSIPSSVRIAAVGPGTAETLRQMTGRDADLVPEHYVAESMAAALAGEASRGARFLLVRANRGRDILHRELHNHGGIVTEIAAYRSSDVAEPDERVAEALSRGEIDWIVVSSSAIAAALVRFFGRNLHRTKLLSIGPIVTQTLTERGHPPDAEATASRMEAIVDFFQSSLHKSTN